MGNPGDDSNLAVSVREGLSQLCLLWASSRNTVASEILDVLRTGHFEIQNILSEVVVLLQHLLEVVLVHNARVLHSVEVIENKRGLLAV